MSIWEQRRKEREQQKQPVQAAPQQSKNVKQFPQPKQGPTIAKGAGPKIQNSQAAAPNIVSKSAITNLVAKPISEEYGGAMDLQNMQQEKLSFSQFQEQKGQVQQQMYNEPERQQRNQDFNIGGNAPVRHYEESAPQVPQISKRQAEIDRMNQGQNQGFTMVGERQNQPKPTYQSPQASQGQSQQQYQGQQQQGQQPLYPQQDMFHAGPKMVAQRAKKPSEMTKQEYEEYEMQLQKNHHAKLIQKVLYDKSVTTFDKMDCDGLRKVDKDFARIYDNELAKKESVQRESQRVMEEEQKRIEYEKQQQINFQQQQEEQIRQSQQQYQQPQQQQQQFQQPSYQKQSSPPQAEFEHYQRAYQNPQPTHQPTHQQFSTAPQNTQMQHELDDLRKEVVMLRQKLQNAEFSVGKYERQITELSNELQDERYQRIQANKAVDDASKDMIHLREEMQVFQSQVQQFQKVEKENQKIENVLNFAQESYKPNSDHKVTAADKLLLNANAVLNKYQDLDSTFKNNQSLNENQYNFNQYNTIQVEPSPDIRYTNQQTIQTKNSVLPRPSSSNMLRNDNDLMSTEEMNRPPVSIPMAIMDNIHDIESRETNVRDIKSQQSMFESDINSMLPRSNFNGDDIVKKYAGLPRPGSGKM